jgi:hypothetical protein
VEKAGDDVEVLARVEDGPPPVDRRRPPGQPARHVVPPEVGDDDRVHRCSRDDGPPGNG